MVLPCKINLDHQEIHFYIYILIILIGSLPLKVVLLIRQLMPNSGFLRDNVEYIKKDSIKSNLKFIMKVIIVNYDVIIKIVFNTFYL